METKFSFSFKGWSIEGKRDPLEWVVNCKNGRNVFSPMNCGRGYWTSALTATEIKALTIAALSDKIDRDSLIAKYGRVSGF